MKVVELGATRPTIDELMGLAKQELLLLRQPDGSVYVLSPVDDFAAEVELLKNNPEFMAFLRERSKEKPAISLEDLRKELAV